MKDIKKSSDITSYYNDFNEDDRLISPWGQLEFVRSKNIISSLLKSERSVILDIGGATGRYSLWLAGLGHEVHLVDPVTRHVEQARAASASQPDKPIVSANVGDARSLNFADGSADMVLLMGPLYHLTKREDRMKALSEAYRVLKPGGYLIAVAISRFASTIDGFSAGFCSDPVFQKIIQDDLTTGQHRNPTDNKFYFMNTFFHHPRELTEEIVKAGFSHDKLIMVEGLGYIVKDFNDMWRDEERRKFYLEITEKIEEDPAMIGASPHIMGVGIKA